MVNADHSNFNIPPKKKKKKSNWMSSFHLASRATAIDKVEFERKERARHIANRRIQSNY